MFRQSLMKHIEDSLIYLNVASFILCLISYLNSSSDTKFKKMSGMVFAAGLFYCQGV